MTGPFWNLDAGKDRPAAFKEESNPGISNWECLLDADPPESVEDALKRLQDPAWRTWIAAREELVAAGLPAAPKLLGAMSKADGEPRDRIEGCLSRNARDARNGRKRGILDTAKVIPFLRDRNAAVTDIAAEMIASCSDSGAAELKKNLQDPSTAASCIRALGIAKDNACAKNLVQILGNQAMPVRARAEAARVLGVLRDKDTAGAVLTALREAKENDLRKEALWSLALLKHTEADKDIAALLDSDDDEIRYRAAMALLILGSPEIKRLEAWLSGTNRNSMEIAAWTFYMAWRSKPKDAIAVLTATRENQKDETMRNRLGEWIDHISGVKKK
jgi:HEAT repeat protein